MQQGIPLSGLGRRASSSHDQPKAVMKILQARLPIALSQSLAELATLSAAGSMDAGSLGMIAMAPFRALSIRATPPACFTARSTLETLRWVNKPAFAG